MTCDRLSETSTFGIAVYAACRRLARRTLSSVRPYAFPQAKPSIEKPACNICGFRLKASREALSDREAPSCPACGSSMRFRAIMAAFQTELDNTHQIQVLERLPKRKSIKGIGMSDANVYAAGLRRKFDYLNTFFHTQPRLDIRSPDPHYIGQYDFVVSSDVMEHVDGPCERALGNLRMLLKPGGLLALTVPYTFEGGTVEHFPELHDYRIEGKGTDRVLVNVTRDGREQRFSDLCFHGGDGSTLELRIYAFNDLMRLLGEMGFTDIKLHDTDHPQWGIIHRHRLGAPVTARAG